ncbi:MAG: DNA mismatch repair protein MutS, partial [Thermodesulfobacteriota bacterium]
ELKEYEDKVLSSQERIIALEDSIFQGLKEEVDRFSSRIQKIAHCIGILDCLLSLAQIADERDYSRPLITDDAGIAIRGGRHPVVETLTQEGFVPNDTFLNGDEGQMMILTGPNMAGKSTYMRQVALIVIMAQMGGFVPAEGAEIGLVDRVFTRIGAMDDISRGQSTFMVEMAEVANILHHATSRSLIILDEVGRGTSTFDGVSIAWAIAEFIHDHPPLGARTLFATHYHELTELAMTKEGVKNYNILVKEWNEKIIFLRKVVKGGVSRSYGIQVARLAGLPNEVLERAREILHNLEGGELDEKGLPRIASSPQLKRQQPGKPQLSLFRKEDSGTDTALRDEIKGIDIDSMTPVEALNKLDHLKKLIS